MNLDTTLASDINVPMVIASAKQTANPDCLLTLIAEHHDQIIKQLNQHGAFLFRGFACEDVDYFSQAIEQCGLGVRISTRDYEIARTLLPNEIYTSSDLPGHIPLPLHHEKPRSINPPHHVYFCCVTPPQSGGGTLFANAQSIWRDMPKNIQDKITEHGVTYRQFFHGNSSKYHWIKKWLSTNSAHSWSEYFGTNDKMLIEKKLTHDKVNWEWVDNSNDLILNTNLPGALKHPITRQTNWFNSSGYLNYYSNSLYGELNSLPWVKYIGYRYMILKDMLPMVCHYGNGQPFSPDEIAEINRVLQKHTCILQWQKGDFIVVDNFTFMHGKQAHQGERLIYSCMTMMQ